MFAPRVDRSADVQVVRIDVWLPVIGNPGNAASRLFSVSGLESKLWRTNVPVIRLFVEMLWSRRTVGK